MKQVIAAAALALALAAGLLAWPSTVAASG